jgi:hypothetical protein
MKNTYYYIDESGGIDSDSNYFILGCYKTDSPDDVCSALDSLKTKLLNEPYFALQRDKFLKHGFHACKNHPDIRARFYNLVSTLNARFYILLLKKDSVFYKKMMDDKFSSFEKYNMCIKKLLSDRLTKTRNDNNIIIFEQYGNKPNNWLKNVESVIQEVTTKIDDKFGTKIACNVSVHDKSDLNLSVIDYINYLFVQFFEKDNVSNRMKENFAILEPKIALIYKMDKDLFYDKNKRLNINEY